MARTGFLSSRRCRPHQSPSNAQQRRERSTWAAATEPHEEQRGKEQKREPRARRARPALASWAVTLTPDFTRLLEGKRDPLLQPRTDNQGFRNWTAPAGPFSSWCPHIQRNPAAEHGCPFLRENKEPDAPKFEMPQAQPGEVLGGFFLPSCSGPISSTQHLEENLHAQNRIYFSIHPSSKEKSAGPSRPPCSHQQEGETHTQPSRRLRSYPRPSSARSYFARRCLFSKINLNLPSSFQNAYEAKKAALHL